MDDVNEALAALPQAEVLMHHGDGMPSWVVGELAKIGEMQFDDAVAADNVLRPQLTPILKVFRLNKDDLKLRKMNVDEEGNRHFRYQQVRDGQPVVGGDLIVHVDVKGAVFGVNGTARGDLDDSNISVTDAQASAKVNGDNRFAGLTIAGSRQVWLQDADGAYFKTYEKIVEGKRGQDPARDKVYVDVASGNIVAIHPTIHFAENRQVYSANNGSSTPGTLKRSEGQAATADVDVNAAYDNTGAAYEGYKFFFNRDSYNNAGASLISSVHYSTNYCNAYWDGTQMVYGDGNASQGCAPLARSVDVTAHELTHAVTENESNLTYSGESGGMNEALSDIFGAVIESYVDGGKNGSLPVSAGTWLVGEDVLPPALRYMNDPVKDGASLDFWTSSAGNVDVHYSSGIGNLAFYLLAAGGQHPRGKSTTNVTGIGLEKAARVFYKANTDFLTASSKYAQVRTATESAAAAIGLTAAEQASVSCAWAAVGVGTAPTSCGGTTPPPTGDDVVLSNGVAVTGVSGATGESKWYKIAVPANQTSLVVNISGGSGDADLYVQKDARATDASYVCRPYISGNNETCTITNPAAATFFVRVKAYTTFSGVSVKATYTGGTTPPPGDPVLGNNAPVTGISGASASWQYWQVTPGAGRTLTVNITGGTGDADLYVRLGGRPTTTTYNCRPYLTGNGETCTFTNTGAGTYNVGLRGYTAYSGVTLKATY